MLMLLRGEPAAYLKSQKLRNQLEGLETDLQNGLASYQANSSAELELLPVKTIPSHFSQVYDASEE